jgi:hypothetical protein
MYILTLKDEDDEGAYAVENKYGEKVLYLFEEEDDAIRYCNMLEELDYPELEITEINPQVALMACDNLNYQYAIITPNDIVIPPDYADIQNSTI